MKKYVSKFLLCLFKNLGKLIPYFKQKYMTLRKDTILNRLNTYLNDIFKSFDEKYKFEISEGVIVTSNMDYHKIEFNIIYDQSFDFKIYLVYANGVTLRKYNVNLTEETNDSVLDFCKHFRDDKNDLSELFIALNDAV